MSKYKIEYKCKSCGKETYVYGKPDFWGLSGDVIPEHEDRYKKKLCSSCYKKKKRR